MSWNRRRPCYPGKSTRFSVELFKVRLVPAKLVLTAVPIAGAGKAQVAGGGGELRAVQQWLKASKAAPKGLKLVVRYESKMDLSAFQRKVGQLRVFVAEEKAISNVPHRSTQTRRDARSLANTVAIWSAASIRSMRTMRQHGRSELQRLRESDIDHILDLQLNGLNVRRNLKAAAFVYKSTAWKSNRRATSGRPTGQNRRNRGRGRMNAVETIESSTSEQGLLVQELTIIPPRGATVKEIREGGSRSRKIAIS